VIAVCRDADGRLLRDAFEFGEGGGDGVEFVVRVGCQRGWGPFAGRVGGGDIEDVVADVELEIGAGIDWFGACSKVAGLDGWPSRTWVVV